MLRSPIVALGSGGEQVPLPGETALLCRRQQFGQQRSRPPVGQSAAQTGQDTFVLRGAAVGHDLGDRDQAAPAGDAASAGAEAGCAHLHRAEQRHQTAGAVVLERARRAAVAAPATVGQCASAWAVTRTCCMPARVALLSAGLSPSVAARPTAERSPSEVTCCVTAPSSPVTSAITRHVIAPTVRCCPSALYHPPPRFETVSPPTALST